MKRKILNLITLTPMLLLGLLALFSSTLARATPDALPINVNNNLTDAPDANPGDGACETAAGNHICTLRAAIMEANFTPGTAIINLQAGATYVLTRPGFDQTALNGDLDVNGADIILNGNNATIDGGGIDRIFDISALAGAVRVSMFNLTIRNGSSANAATDGNAIRNSGYLTLTNVVVRDTLGSSAGGTVWNGDRTLVLVNSSVVSNTAVYAAGIQNPSGTVTLINSTVSNNTTTAGPGGGIYNQVGTVTLINSTVSRNFANHGAGNGNGGGIANNWGGTVTLVNSTVSDNAADDNGAGIFNTDAGSTINLRSTTVAFNDANADVNDDPANVGTGGGIYNYQGAVNLANTLVSGNGAFLTGADDCHGSLNSEGYNLIKVVLPACSIGGNTAGNKTGQDPLLGSLSYNGGATRTRALRAGSPAIDAANPGGCTDLLGALLLTDQRGLSRTVNGGLAFRCDIGAFEVQRLLFLPLILR